MTSATRQRMPRKDPLNGRLIRRRSPSIQLMRGSRPSTALLPAGCGARAGRRRGYERGLCDDHADWPGLLQTIWTAVPQGVCHPWAEDVLAVTCARLRDWMRNRREPCLKVNLTRT